MHVQQHELRCSIFRSPRVAGRTNVKRHTCREGDARLTKAASSSTRSVGRRCPDDHVEPEEVAGHAAGPPNLFQAGSAPCAGLSPRVGAGWRGRATRVAPDPPAPVHREVADHASETASAKIPSASGGRARPSSPHAVCRADQSDQSTRRAGHATVRAPHRGAACVAIGDDIERNDMRDGIEGRDNCTGRFFFNGIAMSVRP